MTWDPIAFPCDYILLAGKKSPGIATILGASSPRKWDKREGYGISGSFSVFKGRDLADFTVKLKLYTREHWADWYAWKGIVDKLPTRRGGSGKDSGTLDIWHPLLEALDIKAVGVAKVHQPEQLDTGEWEVPIDFMEFRHPKVTLAKPEGSAATPVDPVDEKIKALTDKVQIELLAGDQ